jgi:hypothetical protein
MAYTSSLFGGLHDTWYLRLTAIDQSSRHGILNSCCRVHLYRKLAGKYQNGRLTTSGLVRDHFGGAVLPGSRLAKSLRG